MYKDGLVRDHVLIEDEYFYAKDRELIAKFKENEQQKTDLLERTKHYHKCAKCGHSMEERVWEELQMLACSHCDSVHLNLASLEHIQQHGKLKTFLSEMSQVLGGKKRTA